MDTHRYILSAGHRNLSEGGANGEIGWTYGATVRLRDAILRRGGEAWIIQEEDGDGDPSYYRAGGLQQAARACVSLMERKGKANAYISMHYNGTGHAGAGNGFHGVFPDSPTGGVDVAANNSLDIRLINAIAARVGALGTVALYGGTGRMSERSTRVGGQGNRLGEFVGTLGFRRDTARVILEAGNISNPTERDFIRDPAWVDRYAEAVVDGLEDVFGNMRTGRPAVPPANPIPDISPIPAWPAPVPIPELASGPTYLKLANGSQLIRVNYRVRSITSAPRFQFADASSAQIGDNVPVGTVFDVEYLIVNPGGDLWWYTPAASRFRFADAVVYDADVDDDVVVIDG